MKLIELTTNLIPSWRRGDSIVVPDDIADRLLASGEGINPRPFGPKEPSIADREIVRPKLPPDRPVDGKPSRRRYLTK